MEGQGDWGRGHWWQVCDSLGTGGHTELSHNLLSTMLPVDL